MMMSLSTPSLQRCARTRTHLACRSRWPAAQVFTSHSRQAPRQAATVAASATEAPLQLVLYTKEGCPLCDGLQEKVSNIITRAQFMPSVFTSCQLEVRDILSKPEWEAAYSMAVPVLCMRTAQGQEVELPRTPPRTSADRVQAQLAAAIAALQQ